MEKSGEIKPWRAEAGKGKGGGTKPTAGESAFLFESIKQMPD